MNWSAGQTVPRIELRLLMALSGQRDRALQRQLMTESGLSNTPDCQACVDRRDEKHQNQSPHRGATF
jgi:hypothetical protein